MEDDNLLSEIVDHISYLTIYNQRLILSQILLMRNDQELSLSTKPLDDL